MTKFIIIVFAFIVMFPVDAFTVYKKVHKNGKIEYSDTPFPGAQEVELPPVNTQDALPLPPIVNHQTSSEPTIEASISIVSPSHEDTIRNNFVKLTIVVQKEVGKNDDLLSQLFINDKPYLEPSQDTVFKLENLDRGAIKIKVNLQSRSGSVLATSKEVIVYMHRSRIIR